MTNQETILAEKLYLFCEHFYFSPGIPDWSDVTPGEDATMGCWKNIISIDLFEDSLESYREKILTARTCWRYKQVDLEKDEQND